MNSVKKVGYVMITHNIIKNVAGNRIEYNQMVEPLPEQCFHLLEMNREGGYYEGYLSISWFFFQGII